MDGLETEFVLAKQHSIIPTALRNVTVQPTLSVTMELMETDHAHVLMDFMELTVLPVLVPTEESVVLELQEQELVSAQATIMELAVLLLSLVLMDHLFLVRMEPAFVSLVMHLSLTPTALLLVTALTDYVAPE